MLSKKAEIDLAENRFYVFVCLPSQGEPVFYVEPRKDDAKYVRESHSERLQAPGRKGQKHNDTEMRRFKDKEGKYKNKWDLLGLDLIG
jgi:hypothetical protein